MKHFPRFLRGAIGWTLLFSSMSVAAIDAALPISLPQVAPVSAFSHDERARVIAYWNAPDRYQIGPRAGARSSGAYVVRLTPEASLWFHVYNRALTSEKVAPTKNEAVVTSQTRPWEIWIAAKLKFDQARAEQHARAANAELFADSNAANSAATLPIAVADTLSIPPAQLPPHPGPIPPDLLALVGNAPPFAAPVVPLRHMVRFESGESFTYTDHILSLNPRNPYYRFAQGVASNGTSLSKIAPDELEQIFAASNLTPTETRVMRAVSLLEGGFDSINTYDTGFVSVGFIQFAALENGNGSLGALLKTQKEQNPMEFARDFRDFGVDVNAAGALVVVDPASGAELSGNAAVRKIIDDKRLTAVFHLAGRRSIAFRAAQLHVAKANYYPADSPLEVNLNGQILKGRVSDVIQSEAGLATLFDRKVNVGNVRLINSVLQKIMVQRGLTQLEQLRSFEREIIIALKWRRDYLKDTSLSQPI